MKQLDDLVRRFDASAHLWSGAMANGPLAFPLENGGQQLEPFFADVSIRRYQDSLVVTEAGPLVDYILSGGMNLAEERRVELTRFVQQELAQRGHIDITKDSGLFVGVKSR